MILAATRPAPGRHKSTSCPSRAAGLDVAACRRCEDDAAPIQAARIATDAKSHRAPKRAAVWSQQGEDIAALRSRLIYQGKPHRAEAAAFERASA